MLSRRLAARPIGGRTADMSCAGELGVKLELDVAKEPDRRDIEVGRRVRTFRLQKGLSQEKLGDELGITFQQISKIRERQKSYRRGKA